MIPEWLDLDTQVYKSYGTPPDIPYDVSATSIGPIALSDSTSGLTNKFWGVGFDPASKEIRLWDAGTETVLYTETEAVTNLSLAFTQNASVVATIVTVSGILKLYWFDVSISNYTVASLDTGVSQALATMDMKEEPESALSDVLLAYIKAGAIFTRVQRENYLIVGATSVVSDAVALTQSGMSIGQRFQVTYQGCQPPAEEPGGIPLP
tara:strand:- start:3447 stop:4070 length:624 start_codon:yes stop_codon:yes gene_type:complete